MRDEAARFRWRLVAGCVLLLGLAMTQSAGLIVPDTKLDLAIAPSDFLARAAHMWDAEGAFGQLQNQAYGYLWPMGPFFALGALAGLDPWVVQRLWMALVLCVAFVGAAKVARALGVTSHLGAIAGGIAFALSPRMLSVIGPSSIEVWPSALAPWVLLPLVIGASRGSARRAAALSALAVAMVGGVNAAATSAVLPLGAVWLLTRSKGQRRRTMIVWWPIFTLLGTVWWLIPLFLLGRYSPPFLDFIESAGVTTFPTTLVDALRGSSAWVPYVDAQSQASLDLLRDFQLILNTGTMVVLGVAGWALARNPHRRFLVAGSFAGLFLVTMGHTGAAQGLFAEPLKSLLDGALAPLRNVHKFDPVIRLPLVVGLAFTLEEARARLAHARTTSGQRADRVTAGVLVGSVLVALVGSTMPLLQGDVAARNGFRAVPGYWQDAARWLGSRDDSGVALLVPGSSFGTYVWGEPRDEPLQALAGSAWAVRNAVPLVPPGNIRMLNAIEESVNQGVGGRGLSAFLARAGITHVVVRNDLVRTAAVADPVLVHQALESSPGLARVATFGPAIGGRAEVEGDLGRALINGGWQDSYPALEVFEVRDAVPDQTRVESPTTVVGGPEDLLSAAEAGVIGTEPTIVASDVDSTEPPVGPVLLTDGLRLVERNFGALHDATSPTLSGDEPATLPGVVSDYDLADEDRWATRSRLLGAESVGASSSRSDASTPGGSRPGDLPFAAVDGDPSTAWVSQPFPSEPQSWWVDFGAERDMSEISVTNGANSGAEQLRLRTADWRSPVLEFEPGETRTISGPARGSRLWVEDVSGRPENDLSLSEVSLPGLRVERELVLPTLPPGWGDPDAILLRRVGDGRSGCAEVDGEVRCRVGMAGWPEEPTSMRRSLELPDATEKEVRLSVRARPGAALDALVQRDLPVSVTTSSTGVPDPRASATAMLDGDIGTTWVAEPTDVRPVIDINLLQPARIRGLVLGVAFGTAARLPESFELSWPGGTRRVELDDDGAVRFPPIRTSRLRLAVQDAEAATDLDFEGSAREVPVGIGELRLVGVPYVPVSLSNEQVELGCGSGPRVRVNSRTYRTNVTASPTQLLHAASVSASLCGGSRVRLAEGVNRVDVLASDGFIPDSLLLGSLDQRSVGAGPAYVVTTENTNAGWRAEEAGADLGSQVFDGWRQGWQTSGEGPVSQRFAPDSTYRAGLLLGLIALVMLVVGVVGSRRGSEAPALGEAAGARAAWAVAIPGACLILLGWIGAAVGLLAVALVLGLLRGKPQWEGWAYAGLMAPAVAAYLVKPWGGSGWAGDLAWPPYFALLALAALAAWATLSEGTRRAASRMNGRSTSQ